MNFPNWVIHAFIGAGVALLIYDIVNSDWMGVIVSCCIITIGLIAVWNKKNPRKAI